MSRFPRASTDERVTDRDLHDLLNADVDRGWDAFVRQHTDTMLRLVERAGIRDHDEAMEIYVLVCERLAADRCARLRRRDPAKGTLAGWLAALVRHGIVDWVRSRAGRRRVFGAIKALEPFDQKVFELHYWDRHPAGEIAQMLSMRTGVPVEREQVLEAIDRLEQRLTGRQRSDLLSLAARAARPAALDDPDFDSSSEPADAAPDPEAALVRADLLRAATRAAAALPAEDFVMLRLRFLQGLSEAQVARALGSKEPVGARIERALGVLRMKLRST